MKPIEEIEELRHHEGCGVNLRSVVFSVLLFYTLLLLFNAKPLYKKAMLMEYGPMRTICVQVTEPISELSEGLHIDRFRAFIEQNIENKGV
jgi:hypothetical protein